MVSISELSMLTSLPLVSLSEPSVSISEPLMSTSLPLIEVRLATISSAWPVMGWRAGSMPPRLALTDSTWLGRVLTSPPAPVTASSAVARLPLMEANELVMAIR